MISLAPGEVHTVGHAYGGTPASRLCDCSGGFAVGFCGVSQNPARTLALAQRRRPRHIPCVPLRTKRWNDPQEPDDGLRLLVCRYRPRGVKKDDETWDVWCKHLGPSEDLHAAVYGKHGEPIPWDEYTRRYHVEMRRQTYWLKGFAKKLRDGEAITLLCSSACTDPARCHRTLLAKLLEDEAFPPPPARPGVIRRSSRT